MIYLNNSIESTAQTNLLTWKFILPGSIYKFNFLNDIIALLIIWMVNLNFYSIFRLAYNLFQTVKGSVCFNPCIAIIISRLNNITILIGVCSI